MERTSYVKGYSSQILGTFAESDNNYSNIADPYSRNGPKRVTNKET